MPLIDCEINLHLKWPKKFILVAATTAYEVPEFTITDTKPYVAVAALPIQDKVKLLKQLESVLKEQLIGISINLKRQN